MAKLPAAAGAVAGFGGWGGQWLRNRDYRALADADQTAVRAAFHSGKSTGRAKLDRIAVRRLREYIGQAGAARYLAPLGIAFIVGIPVAAAVIRSPWWLLATVVSGFAYLRWRPRREPVAALKARLALLGSTSADSEAERES